LDRSRARVHSRASEAEKSRIKSPHRIIGVVADVDDDHIVPVPTSTVYDTFADGPLFGGHLFIHTTANPYSLVTPVTKLSGDVRR
jgi:putative ABC transport system permease protein